MSMIVSSCQHYDEQHFKILPCVYHTIFSVVKLDMFIRAHGRITFMLWEKLRVRLPYILFMTHIVYVSLRRNAKQIKFLE